MSATGLTGTDERLREISKRIKELVDAQTGEGIVVINTPSSSNEAAFEHYRTTNLTSTPQQIKNAEGNLYGLNITNLTAVVKYVKFVDALAADTTVGTTPVKTTIRVPGNVSLYLSGEAVQYHFGTAITVYAVTGAADANTASPTANGLMVDFKYI